MNYVVDAAGCSGAARSKSSFSPTPHLRPVSQVHTSTVAWWYQWRKVSDRLRSTRKRVSLSSVTRDQGRNQALEKVVQKISLQFNRTKTPAATETVAHSSTISWRVQCTNGKVSLLLRERQPKHCTDVSLTIRSCWLTCTLRELHFIRTKAFAVRKPYDDV